MLDPPDADPVMRAYPLETGRSWKTPQAAASMRSFPKLRSVGGKAVRLTHSRRNPVEVTGADGVSRIVRVRSKLDGDWQARRQDESLESDDTRSEFWVFVDLAADPHEFYMLPSNEVADDIRAEVDLWIMDSPPGRNRTGHHAIPRGRVVHGHDRWDALGLAAVKDPSIYVETPGCDQA